MLDGNKHLPVAKPRRLPQHISYLVERLALKNRESSAMDRRLTSFCCASRLAYHRDKARETQCCKWSQCLQLQTKMSKLYVSPPRKVFPVKAAYTPPFRFHGMADNRLLPHIVCKGGKLDMDGGISQNPLYGLLWKSQRKSTNSAECGETCKVT